MTGALDRLRQRFRKPGYWFGPTAALGIILVIAAVLILQMTIRPWGGPDRGWETHFNYDEAKAGYTRSLVTNIGQQANAPHDWVPSDHALGAEVPAYADYVALGCASCHGFDGEGSPSGPPVAAGSERRIVTLTRKGPGQMPAYAEDDLPEVRMNSLAELITSMSEIPPTPEPVVMPVATPWPSPTPTPTPTPAPTPTATPLPPGAPTPGPPTPVPPTAVPPTALPEATATPTPDPALLAAAQKVYIDLGCDLCHGVNGEGAEDGPDMHGLDAEGIRDFTREPKRPSDSKFSKKMDAYTVKDLSEQELDEIIFFLLNLPW